MKFPDVTQLGAANIEGVRFVILMVNENWEPDNGHDSDHARGGCECPCSQPLDMLLEAAEVPRHTFEEGSAVPS